MIRAFLFLTPLLIAVPAARADDCVPHETVIERTTATADVLANAFSRGGSLRKESERLITKAHELSARTRSGDAAPKTVLTSVPSKFRKDQPAPELCERKLQETQREPFVVSGQKVESLDALFEWISDFSQGKGEHGKRMYERCDGGCSPQYSFTVSDQPEGLSVDAVVRCGLARDRDDNRYTLTALHRWTCGKPMTAFRMTE